MDPRALVRPRSGAAGRGGAARVRDHAGVRRIVVFSGNVRDHHQGRGVVRIDYEAVEPLARKKLEEICAEVLAEEGIHRVAAVHRTGRVEVGEASVIVAAYGLAPRRRLPRRAPPHRPDQGGLAGVEARALHGRKRGVGAGLLRAGGGPGGGSG